MLPLPGLLDDRLGELEAILTATLSRGWLSGLSGPARIELQDAADLLQRIRTEATKAAVAGDGEALPSSRCASDDEHAQADEVPSSATRRSVTGSFGLGNFDFEAKRRTVLTALATSADPDKDSDEEDGGMAMGRQMTESRRWLVETFTSTQLTRQRPGLEAFVEGDDEDEEEELSEVEGSDCRQSDPGRKTPENDHKTKRRHSADLGHFIDTVLDDPEVHNFMQQAGSLSFDALAFTGLGSLAGHPLQCLGVKMVADGLISTLAFQGKLFDCSEKRFQTAFIGFLGRIDGLYNAVPYHCGAHAVDVVTTTQWFAKSEFMRNQMTSIDTLLVLVAAAIHDVGHGGRNNEFLKKNSPLADMYYEESILENMHLAKAFEVMKKEQLVNWLGLLASKYKQEGRREPGQDNLQKYVRAGLIEMVLATDNAKHDDHLRRLERLLVEVQAEGAAALRGDEAPKHTEIDVLDRKYFMFGTVLHAADISNPCKPQPIMLQWTERVLEEFWAQGDEEKGLGLPISPLCDRASGSKAVPKGQVGFITFVVLPYYQLIAKIVLEVEEALSQLNENVSFWKGKEQEQATPETLFARPAAVEVDEYPAMVDNDSS